MNTSNTSNTVQELRDKHLEAIKIIAEFMGHRFTGDGVKKPYCMYLPNQEDWSFSAWNVEGYPDSLNEKIEAYFKYHTSWDWLMPVFKKLNELFKSKQIQHDMESSAIHDCLLYSILNVDINSAHKLIVQLIQWYNINN